jgi:RNA polymerase sigma-70 factor (ECF subfamily)
VNNSGTPAESDGDDLRDAALDASFSGFFQRHYRQVLRFLSRQEADRQLVEDVAQEAFMAAREKWAQVREFTNPVAWVLRVARNILAGKQKARVRRPAVPLDEEMIRESVPPADPDEAEELLATWLRRLPPRQGEVFALVHDDFSDREIGQILGLAYSTVRTYKADARERLRRMAEEAGFGVPAGRRRR